MSDTPPSFPIPDFDDDDTQRHVIVKDVKGMASATMHLVRLETKRGGQLQVLLWLVGLAITLGVPFLAFITLRIEDVRADVHAAIAETHARLDSQQHDLDALRQKEIPR